MKGKTRTCSPLEPVPGSPLCPGDGSSAAGPRLSPGSLRQWSVSAGHNLISPTWIDRRHMQRREEEGKDKVSSSRNTKEHTEQTEKQGLVRGDHLFSSMLFKSFRMKPLLCFIFKKKKTSMQFSWGLFLHQTYFLHLWIEAGLFFFSFLFFWLEGWLGVHSLRKN